MLPYIEGDPRFKRIKPGKISFFYLWALKEFKNLKKAFKSGIRVPEPVIELDAVEYGDGLG